MRKTLLTLFALALLPMMVQAQADKKLINKAQNGDTKAMVLLGECYEVGAGVDMDSTLALKWFQRAANAGDGEGWLRVSRYYRNSTLLPCDTSRFFAIRKQWADSGIANAYAGLYGCYKLGIGTAIDTAKAREMLDLAVKNNSTWGLSNLALNYFNGRFGCAKDTKKAVSLLQKAYKMGYWQAASELAQMYSNMGDKKNTQKWIEEGLKWNDPDAVDMQARTLFFGFNGAEKDQAKALQLFSDLIKKHHNLSYTQAIAGYAYLVADSLPLRDTARALSILNAGLHLAEPTHCADELGDYYASLGQYEQAYPLYKSIASRSLANDGDGDACYKVGQFHQFGLGCDSSMTEAIRWYERGVEVFQNSKCASILADLYTTEEYRNLPQAVSYYRLADKYGDTTALAKLGYLYMQNGNTSAASDCYDEMIAKGDANGYFWKAAVLANSSDNNKEILSLYTTGEKKGSSMCAYALGQLYEEGELGLKANAKTAAKHYEKSGLAAAKYRLGALTLNGDLGKVNEKTTAQGLEYINEAAAGDHVDALYALGNFYETGRYVDTVDEAKAALYYQYLADNDVPAGLVKMGYFNEEGYADHPADTVKAAQCFERAAALGNGEAMCCLGDYYRSGILYAKDSARAFDYYTQAHEAGDEIGTYYIGRSYLEGCGVSIDTAYAIPYLKTATAQGVGNAAFQVAEMYNYGRGGLEQNGDSALYYYIKGHEYGSGDASNYIGQELLREGAYDKATGYLFVGAKRGNADATVTFGYCEQQGIGLDSANAKDAYKLFEYAAKRYKAPAAYYQLGLACLQGLGCPEDQNLGKAYLDTAADMGHVGSMYYLGMCLLNGMGCRVDTAAAISWLERAADNESIRAINELGDVYEAQGDFKNAVLYYEKGVAMESLESYCNLGYCYEQGQGVVLNSQKAYELYLYAAEHGSTRGMRCVAGCYIHGIYVEESAVEALNWFTKAAEAGDVVAMYYCGAILEEGADGVAADRKAAIKWYKQAATAGYEPAAAALARM